MNHKKVAAVLGMLAFAAVQSAAGAELPTLRYGGDEGLPHLPLIIAQKKGFFAKEGIRVEVVTLPAAAAGTFEQGYVAAIERGGPSDMTEENAGFFLDAVLHGSDAVAVGVQTANPVYSLIVRPEIKNYAALKGKTVTLTATWDAITLTARALLAKHGVGRNDFTFEAMRNSGPRLECMKQGKCVAIAAVQPTDTQAINLGLGFHSLGTTYEAGPVTFYMDVVRREWAKTHQDTIVRYLRAEADAIRFIHDPKNRGEVATTIGEITHVSPDLVNQLVAAYADPKQGILSKHGEFDLAGFNNLLRFAKDSGNYDKPLPPAEKFVDLSYVKAAGIQ